jgi:signal transduction histidine kinase
MQFDEGGRLEALRDYRVLSTPDGGVFDDIAMLASRIFSAPIVMVTLLAETNQLFKGRVGFSVNEAPREHSFCNYAIRQDDPLVVNDLSLDERFNQNPLVLGGLRFYCGVPVRTPEGHALGTLCLMDKEVREISSGELHALKALGRRVEDELEMRRRLAWVEETVVVQREQQRTRDLLTAMVVHDLRGPLTSLTLSAALVRPADDESREDLERVQEAAERMRRMLSDMLDISLYDAGKLKVRKTQFCMADLVRSVTRRLTKIASEKQQVFQLEGEERAIVEADPELLERVLSNLVGNAMAHGPSNQPIIVSVRASPLRVEVRDSGKVISEPERERIFEAHTRGEAASSKGYGLGLAFCRMAVNSHGGKIGVEPNGAGGNCFFFELP